MMQTASELSISLSASLASTSSISDLQLLRIKTTPLVLEANTTQGSFIIPSSKIKVLTTSHSHSRIIVKTYSTADSAATMLKMIGSFKWHQTHCSPLKTPTTTDPSWLSYPWLQIAQAQVQTKSLWWSCPILPLDVSPVKHISSISSINIRRSSIHKQISRSSINKETTRTAHPNNLTTKEVQQIKLADNLSSRPNSTRIIEWSRLWLAHWKLLRESLYHHHLEKVSLCWYLDFIYVS